MYDELTAFIQSWFRTEDFIPLHEPRFSGHEREYVLDAIDSTFVSSVGAYVDRFENELASWLDTRKVVAAVNGTAALQVALRLVGVKPGDEVITQPLTFVATANAIDYNGAHPVFLDVDRDTMGLSALAVQNFLAEHVERRDEGSFNRRTGRRIAAILPMHTFGHPCRIKELCAVADDWRIPVVEDAAEALGSRVGDRHCGTFGQLGVYSFNGNKTITCGGGGAISSADVELATRAKHLTTTAKVPHPWAFVHDEIGYNYRMPNLNAALACAQLERLPALLADKRLLAEAYRKYFSRSDWCDFLAEPAGCTSNYWLNVIILKDPDKRDEVLAETNRRGIMTRPIWRLMNELDIYRNCQTGSLENARWLEQRVVNLPSSPRLGK